MKLLLVNGSPKKNESASRSILEDFKTILPDGADISELHLSTHRISESEIAEFNGCDAVLFAFPLYVDGIPSNLLACLKQLEKAGIKQNTGVYCIVNCGFYEGIQCKTAIDILKNWSDKLGLSWGMGIGFGGGGGLAYMGKCPVGKGPKVSFGKSLTFMSERILHRESAENQFISINFPRFMYKLGAESGWKQAMKENGAKNV